MALRRRRYKDVTALSDWSCRWTSVKKTESKSVIRHYDTQGHGSHIVWKGPDPLFHYHRDVAGNYREPLPPRPSAKQQMANVLPWLMTMSLLGFREFTESLGQNSQISQELEAPPLPQLSVSSVDFLTPSTSSFDDPAFGHEEPPLQMNCDHVPNPSYENSIGQAAVTGKPQGFQIDPNSVPAQQHHRSQDKKKNERNINGLGNGASPNGILQSSKVNYDDRANESERFYNPEHTFRPSKDTGFKDEYAGPAVQLAFYWKTIDYEFDNENDRNNLMYSGTFVPENNLPLGLEIWKEKIFISLPRWKKGIPATLTTISANSFDRSPKLKPYPNWSWHDLGNCRALTSVFRMQIDECDRLWVLDSGKIDITTEPKQVCPPTIYVFDLYTDELLRSFELPEDQIKEDSLYSNIVVDVRNNQCDRAIAYAADVWRFGLIVYDYFNDTSFRIQHHFFFPDPLSSRYNLHGLEFQWTDGLFAIALTPLDVNDEKTMFFHPMSSFREFAVPVSVISDKRLADKSFDKFVPVGKPRAKDYGHSSGSAIDRNGVMFFNMVTRDSVWCWDTRKEYIPQNLGVIGSSNVSLVFPNDIKMDHEEDQNVWILSNKLPMYLYGYMKKDEINFRILKANIKRAIADTVCDPNYIVSEYVSGYDVTC